MRRLSFVLVLILASCGRSTSKVENEKKETQARSCAEHVAALAKLRQGPPEGWTAGAWLPSGIPAEAIAVVAGSTPVPAADRRMIPEDDSDLARLQANGVDDPYVYLVADRRVAASRLGRGDAPPQELRLVVRRPPSEIVDEHLRVFPAPARLRPMLEEAIGRGGGLAAHFEALGELSRGCPQIAEAFELFKMGAGIDVVGPGVAEALDTCGCKLEDTDALVALFLLVTMSAELGWMPLDADALAKLPPDATAADLAPR